MFVKTVGSILIIGSATLFGISQKARLSRRVNILSSFILALDIMYSEVSCMCTPTEDVIKKLCEVTNGAVAGFFRALNDLHKKRKDLPLAIVWNRVLKENTNLDLAKQELQTLSEFGNSFGRYNSDETLRTVLHTKRTLEGYLKSANTALSKLGKLYGNLSIISGVALVIILI